MFALVGVAVNVVANSGPGEVKFESKKGTVTYKHAEHTKRGAECQSCHHQADEKAGADCSEILHAVPPGLWLVRRSDVGV